MAWSHDKQHLRGIHNNWEHTPKSTNQSINTLHRTHWSAHTWQSPARDSSWRSWQWTLITMWCQWLIYFTSLFLVVVGTWTRVNRALTQHSHHWTTKVQVRHFFEGSTPTTWLYGNPWWGGVGVPEVKGRGGTWRWRGGTWQWRGGGGTWREGGTWTRTA